MIATSQKELTVDAIAVDPEPDGHIYDAEKVGMLPGIEIRVGERR